MRAITFLDIGKKDNQEDSLYPFTIAEGNGRIFLVCDGMGGHENGEVASNIVAETIGQYTTEVDARTIGGMKEAFCQALDKSYDKLDEEDKSTSVRKMGTTLTFMGFCDDGILVAHIGDSRVYQFRKGKGIVFQTKDHSLVNELIDSGKLKPEEAFDFPYRNIITRAIMPHQPERTQADFDVLTNIQDGDIFMLCSDGLVEQLRNEDLENILLQDKTFKERFETLTRECSLRDTHDNFSCILIERTKETSLTSHREENGTQEERGKEGEEKTRVEDGKERKKKTNFFRKLFRWH